MSTDREGLKTTLTGRKQFMHLCDVTKSQNQEWQNSSKTVFDIEDVIVWVQCPLLFLACF